MGTEAKVGVCVNCGSARVDLREHEGELWCPKAGDCDMAFYNEHLALEIAESEEASRRLAEDSRAAWEADQDAAEGEDGPSIRIRFE